ncbi:MAG: hypothetical protein AAFY36_09255, partial [Bacteroidota bacterium]
MSKPTSISNNNTVQDLLNWFQIQWPGNKSIFIGILFIISGIIGMICASSRISPFIYFPQQAGLALNTWALECIDPNNIFYYFIFDVFFAIGLFLINHTLLKRQYGKPRLILLIAITPLLVDILEWPAFNSQNATIYSAVSTVKLVSYGIVLLMLIYKLLGKIVTSLTGYNTKIITPFSEQIIRYFYPGIISTILLIFVLRSLSKFDSLIIELTYGVNLPIFVFLFVITILKVWFMPYYVKFSRTFYRLITLGEYTKQNPDHKELITLRKDYLKKVLTTRSAITPINNLIEEETETEAKKNLITRKEYK